jgi:hypothetical protein
MSVTDELFDGMMQRERGRSVSHRCPRLACFVVICDGLEDLPCAHMIGTASHLAPGLRGRAGDKLQAQASSVVAWHGSPPKRYLHFLKELFSLWLRNPNDQPGEARQ